MSDLSRRLPHRGPALLITAVDAVSAGGVTATGRVPAAHPLHDAGYVPAFLAVEIGAQAAALHESAALDDATARDTAGQPRLGRLVRVRDVAFDTAALPVDTPLQVTATLHGSAPPVAIYTIELRHGDRRLMHGEITTHRGTEDDRR